LSLREAERVHVQRVLEEVAWNKKQAAKILEISRGTLYRKIGEYGLQPRQSEPKLTPAEQSSTG
jgi:DNA-binding NtrC family response regulator